MGITNDFEMAANAPDEALARAVRDPMSSPISQIAALSALKQRQMMRNEMAAATSPANTTVADNVLGQRGYANGGIVGYAKGSQGPVVAPLSPEELWSEVNRAARANGLNPRTLYNLVMAESSGNPAARGPRIEKFRGTPDEYAYGYTQMLPSTAKAMGVTNLSDPRQQIWGGAKYLGEQIRTFGNEYDGLRAYNAGPANARKNPNISNEYAAKILGISSGGARGADGYPQSPQSNIDFNAMRDLIASIEAPGARQAAKNTRENLPENDGGLMQQYQQQVADATAEDDDTFARMNQAIQQRAQQFEQMRPDFAGMTGVKGYSGEDGQSLVVASPTGLYDPEYERWLLEQRYKKSQTSQSPQPAAGLPSLNFNPNAETQVPSWYPRDPQSIQFSLPLSSTPGASPWATQAADDMMRGAGIVGDRLTKLPPGAKLAKPDPNWTPFKGMLSEDYTRSLQDSGQIYMDTPAFRNQKDRDQHSHAYQHGRELWNLINNTVPGAARKITGGILSDISSVVPSSEHINDYFSLPGGQYDKKYAEKPAAPKATNPSASTKPAAPSQRQLPQPPAAAGNPSPAQAAQDTVNESDANRGPSSPYSGAGVTGDLESFVRQVMGDNADYEARIDKRRKQAADMALLQAGLGIAAGRSPYFASNLAGAMPAISQYQKDIGGIADSQDAREQAYREALIGGRTNDTKLQLTREMNFAEGKQKLAQIEAEAKVKIAEMKSKGQIDEADLLRELGNVYFPPGSMMDPPDMAKDANGATIESRDQYLRRKIKAWKLLDSYDALRQNGGVIQTTPAPKG